MGTCKTFSRFAPAKINLMLAITGTRPDGFHNLVSLVAPISLGDKLTARVEDGTKEDSLNCEMLGVPVDDSNLVMRATKLFRKIVPACPNISWSLEKKVPHGAGLGGGSSDAASALIILNGICNGAPGGKILRELAAELGSDCPLFLEGKPVVMRGRGEAIHTIPENAITALRERKFLIFKPEFGIPTAHVYKKMRENAPLFYTSENEAEERLESWENSTAGTLPLFNNMEAPVFEKYIALPSLFEILREQHKLTPHMSGSGSACFAEIYENADVENIISTIRESWGKTAFVEEVKII